MDIKVMLLYLGTIIFLFAIFTLFRAIIVILQQKKKKQEVIGFFHPYTNDGGGGERVLWCMVKALQEEMPSMPCAIYTGDDASPTSLSKRAFDRFGVQLHSMPKVVRLRKRVWVEATSYPYFTLLGQGLGSMVLAWEALCALTPALFIDTSGYAFTYPLASCFGCRVACYTHYPTISTDMLSRVLARKSMYNNKSFISQSKVLSSGKALYYMLISWAYKLVGGFTHLAIVNSSWTQLHIEELWRLSGGVVRIYPPCDTFSLQALPLERKEGHPYIISVAQFRPEKAHDLQLEAFAQALERIRMIASPSGWVAEPKLKLVGSCRHKEDEERVRLLKEKCSALGIEKHVDFHLNVPYEELKYLLAGAVAGLHSMIDEHFGIVVVEYMAAGAVPIAHNSAGPKMDIVLDEDGQRTGFLAVSVEEFSEAIFNVLTMPEEERLCMARAARKRANCFSEERFDRDFKVAMQPILASLKQKFT